MNPALPSRSLLVTGLVLALAAFPSSSPAQTLTVLHAFGGYDGWSPRAALAIDYSGNVYGSTTYGGIFQHCDNEVGGGVVYRIEPSGATTVLHAFNNQGDGCFPDGVLVDATGNLFGDATSNIFEVNAGGQFSLFHNFVSFRNGTQPLGAMAQDADGNLYGTAGSGGAFKCAPGLGCGTVFKIDSSGHETVLYNFTGKADGDGPAGVIRDMAGDLYGVTTFGANLSGSCRLPQSTVHGCGTVYKLAPDGTFTVLHTFLGGSDGQNPGAALTMDAAGNLYGVTGGGGNMECNAPYGCGTVFKVTPSGVKTVLHAFSTMTQGAFPSGVLALDATGNLYGTTESGGDSQNDGVLFKISKNGKETVLHRFNGTDGDVPLGGVVIDSAGNLYGTSLFGGKGYGSVFKFVP
jgi:uncharacterized repeat protein (TIGR03803 family)